MIMILGSRSVKAFDAPNKKEGVDDQPPAMR